MGEFTVDQIVAPDRDGSVHFDATGAAIRSVFAKVSGRYAVYVTNERVMIQWADSAVLGDDGKPLGPQQRAALAPITCLRGEINGLVDGWRQAPEARFWWQPRNRSRAKRYDRLVADGLEIALAGDVAHATDRLLAVRDAIHDERVALGRVQYALAALATGLVVALASALIARRYVVPVDCTAQFAHAIGHGRIACGDWGRPVVQRWSAVGFGALGAFLSVALQLRSRQVQPNLQASSNVMDAALRIAVGAISATVLVAFMQAGLISIGTGHMTVVGDTVSLAVLIVASVAAGFTERLVSTVIGEVVVAPVAKLPSGASGGSETAPVVAAVTTGGAQATPPPPAGPGAMPPPPLSLVADDDQLDGCPCADDHACVAATDDTELPEATGGVASASRTDGV